MWFSYLLHFHYIFKHMLVRTEQGDPMSLFLKHGKFGENGMQHVLF
jgi:hypothetical protein